MTVEIRSPTHRCGIRTPSQRLNRKIHRPHRRYGVRVLSAPSTRVDLSSLALLVIAVVAISSSAVLVRWTDASPVALAFWRTLGGALILAPAALRSRAKPTATQWRSIVVAGMALGVHFATWLASLELTSVAASVTLVSTAPIIIAVVEIFRGRRPDGSTWLAIGLAVLGTLVIAGSDAITELTADATSGTALVGDGLALIGAGSMALYLMIGDRLRSTLSTAGYAARTYAMAALTMLVVAAGGGVDLAGFDRRTWMVIGAMIVGPQLAGHTSLNHLLGKLGSMTVALTLLAEPLGAALLVLLLFGDIPPAGTLAGGPLVIAAIAIRVLRPLTNAEAQP